MNDEQRAALTHCAICPNMCRFDCPAGRAGRSEAVAPAGKVRVAWMLDAGILPRTAENVEYLYACADCRSCEVWCPMDEVKVADLLATARADAVAAGAVPAAISATLASLAATGHPYADRHPGPLAAADAVGDALAAGRRAPILLLPGCTAAALRPAGVQAMGRVLTAAGVAWATLTDVLCCGGPARTVGDPALELALATRLAAAIAASGAETVVTACPGCAEALTLRYPALGLPLVARVLHFSAYAAELVADGRLSLGPVPWASIVYHDPCSLTRGLELAEAPRAVLTAVPGLTVREPRATGRETHCCGAGGPLAKIRPDLAAHATAERLAELRATGADAIVTACPLCETVFSQAGAATVLDLAELMSTALATGGDRHA
jgi:Fe-S oxidoreductase